MWEEVPAEVWQLVASHRSSVARQLRLVVRFDVRVAAALAIQRAWRCALHTIRWEPLVGGVDGSNSYAHTPSQLTDTRRAFNLEHSGGYRYAAAHAFTTLQPPPTRERPLTFLIMLVLRKQDGEPPLSDTRRCAMRIRVAAFEPGDKGYEKLPLHPAGEDEDEEDEDYSEGTDEQWLDLKFDHSEHTATSACLTTECECFDEQFKMCKSAHDDDDAYRWDTWNDPPSPEMVKTYLRVQIRAASDSRHVPAAFFQLEDDLVLHVDLPEASARARYRLIVSLSDSGYARLLSPAQAARIFNIELDKMNVLGDGSKQAVCV